MRKLLTAVVLLLCVLAVGGASRKSTYSGGTYGVVGGTYQAGGVAAGWDTVSVILFTGPMVTVAAGVDTFAYPASASSADQTRIHRLNDIVLGRGGASWRADNGDTARLYRMGTGYEITTFAYTEIDSGRFNAGPQAKDVSGVATALVSDRRITSDAVAYIPMSANWMTAADTARNRGFAHFELVYAPFDSLLPPDCTIVSASINTSLSGNMYLASGDTVIATLMTNAGDNKWYKVFGWDANHPSIAKATWDRQRSASWGGTTTAHPWVPSLASRSRIWDWGRISDWTGSTVTGAGFIPQYTNFPIDITDCVQAAANGTTNNGIVISLHCYNTSYEKLTHYNWDRWNHATVAGRTPYIHIKYITKRYRQPYVTSDMAFVFTTDDFREYANSAFTDTFMAHGGTYTIFGARKHVDAGAYQSGMDSLLAWLNQGFEIGTHSRQHHDPEGLTYWEQQRPGKVWDATARGQVWFDAEPDWLYALADSAIGDSLSDHPQFGKSMALPNNTISQGVQRVLADIGYLSVRGMAVTPNNTLQDQNKYPWAASWAPAYADTGMSTIAYAQRRPRNMMLLPYMMTTRPLVGWHKQPSTDLDSVRNNMRRALYQVRGQGRGEMVLLTHDLKWSHAQSSDVYADGINPDELGAMLDIVDEFGARYMTASDLGRWRRSGATPIDTPTGFYNASADDDSARYFAADGVWYKPNGIDNRWIRGVK